MDNALSLYQGYVGAQQDQALRAQQMAIQGAQAPAQIQTANTNALTAQVQLQNQQRQMNALATLAPSNGQQPDLNAIGSALLNSNPTLAANYLALDRQQKAAQSQADYRTNSLALRQQAMDGGGLSPDAIKAAAARYRQFGTLPPMGMGPGGQVLRSKILSSAAQMDSAAGISADQAAANQVTGKANAGAEVAGLKDFAVGPQGNSVRSINVATNHLGQISQLADALNNGDNQTVNQVKNSVSAWAGNADPTNMQAIAPIVGAEVTKAVVANGGGEAERQEIANTFSNIKSPQQLQGAVTHYLGLMQAQRQGLKQQYKSATGLDDFDTRFPNGGTPASAQAVHISSDADYAPLKLGTHYVGPDGVERVK